MVGFELGMVPTRPLRESLEWATRAEALGFDGIWAADSQSIFRDAFAALSVLAAKTERMRLATGVTNPVTRHPAVLACSFATLDELSNGRAVMGIGVGASTVRTLGLRPARLAELEKVIATVRRLMEGRQAEWEGTTIEMPWSKRQVPVVIASSGPRSLQLAGRVADGVLFQVGSRPELVRWAISQVQSGAEAAGRDPAEVKLHMRLGCAVSEDNERAREEVRGYAAAAAVTMAFSIPREVMPVEVRADLAQVEAGYKWYQHSASHADHISLLTDEILDTVSVAGTPDSVVERLQGLAHLGIDSFVIPITTTQPMEQVRLLAEHVIPEVRV